MAGRETEDGGNNDVKQWREAGLDRLIPRINTVQAERISPREVRIEVAAQYGSYSLAMGFLARYLYTIRGDGQITLTTTVTPVEKLPVLPRLGLRLQLAGSFDRFTWHGRGPHQD